MANVNGDPFFRNILHRNAFDVSLRKSCVYRLLTFILFDLTAFHACLYMPLFTAKLILGVEVLMHANHVNHVNPVKAFTKGIKDNYILNKVRTFICDALNYTRKVIQYM